MTYTPRTGVDAWTRGDEDRKIAPAHVTHIQVHNIFTAYPVTGFINSRKHTWTREGRYNFDSQNMLDLVDNYEMIEEPDKEISFDLKDYACAALTGAIADSFLRDSPARIAKRAFDIAEAMMAEAEKRRKKNADE